MKAKNGTETTGLKLLIESDEKECKISIDAEAKETLPIYGWKTYKPTGRKTITITANNLRITNLNI